MLAHYFSNLAVPMTLGANMDNSQTTCQLNSLAGLPASYPFFLVVDRDTSDIEMLEATSLASGTTLNVNRGYGDTSPVAHSLGDSVLHVAPAEFYTETLADLATIQADAGLKVKKLAARNSTVSIANTETRVVGVTMPTGSLVAGTVIRFMVSGIQTNTTTASTSVWRVRLGPTTLTGPIVGSWSCALGTTARTNVPFRVWATVVILSSTTAIATVMVEENSATRYAAPTTVITSPVTIATNANQEVELTCISGAASTTWNVFTATEELVAA